MLRTFFRPGWVVLGLVVVAFAALCFSLLAPWQLGKNSATEHRNDLIRSAESTPVAPIAEVAPPGRPFVPDTEWREVAVTGHYLPGDQVIVRLRQAEERPATEVLTPFTDGARTFLVDRGYVRPEQGEAPKIAPAPSGTVTLHARIRKSEGTTPGRGAHVAEGMRAVYTIDPEVVGAQTQLTFDDFYLQLSPNQPGSLGEIALPQLDSGPYLSYGLQWLAFGIMAPLGAVYFIYSEVKHRRAQRAAQQASAAGATTAATPTDEEPETFGARSRQRATRQQLRDGGFVTATRQRHQIGTAPDTAAAADHVRDKLTQRYGQ